MKARDLIGRRIVGVTQFRRFDVNGKTSVMHVRHIDLDNGTRLIFDVHETKDASEYVVSIAATATPTETAS